MNRQEKVSLYVIRNVGALFEGDKHIPDSREDDVRVGEALLDDPPQPQRNVQTKLLLR